MDEATSSKRDDQAMNRLSEMILDHLGIPRAGISTHVQELQDRLLPVFMDAARHAWLAASPTPLQTKKLPNEPSHPVYQHLHDVTESCPQDIRSLNNILEEVGVHALLVDVAGFPDGTMLSSIPLSPYEERLLRAASHPNPGAAMMEYLDQAAKEPGLLAASSRKLEEAAQASLKAHKDITVIINPPPPGAPSQTAEKPKRRKVFSGLGKLFSGLVLLAGNTIVIPTVTLDTAMALPVLGSLAWWQ